MVTPPHVSGGVLWFHVGRPCVHPSEPTFRVSGFNFVTTLCFIPLRYIINFSVRELLALKTLWKFVSG